MARVIVQQIKGELLLEIPKEIALAQNIQEGDLVRFNIQRIRK